MFSDAYWSACRLPLGLYACQVVWGKSWVTARAEKKAGLSMASGSRPSQLSPHLITREHYSGPLRPEAPECPWGPQHYKRGGQAAALDDTSTDPHI